MADADAYGLDRELKAKQAAKYDVGLERQVAEWITAISGDQAEEDQSFAGWLRDGQVLCRLVNAISPGMIKKVNTSSMAFKQMENISFFTEAARKLGVPESAVFSTPDLYEEKNIGSVVNCVYTLGGAVQVSCPGFQGPHLGVPITVESRDKRRSTGRITDQSQGFSATLDVQRPTERILGVVRPNAMSGNPSAPQVPCPPPKASSWIPAPREPAAVDCAASPGVGKDLTQIAQSPAYAPSPASPPPSGSGAEPSAGDADAAAPLAAPPAPAERCSASSLQPAQAAAPEDESLYGMDRELRAKQEAKYDVFLEAQVVEWIEFLIGETKGDQSVGEWLKSGVLLCRLVNAVKPGTIKKCNTSSLAFKQMENITFFTNAIREIGVPESAMFATPDLFEEKNIGSVVNCIYTFGCVVQVNVPEYDGPPLGVAMNVESKSKKRSGGICTDQSSGLSATLETKGHTHAYANK